jgi:MULE transposase domain
MVWMAEEKEVDYNWAITQLVKYLQLSWSSIVITDREEALINAIDNHFPIQTTKHLLCR